MKHLLFGLAFLAALTVTAQNEDGFLFTEKILRSAPDSVFDSTPAFAGFIDSHFTGDGEKLRAIFTWIAKSVSYDVENMYRDDYSDAPVDLSSQTFITRKGICQGYSELFNDLCRQTGITSFVVHGYSKQDGSVADVGHAWIVAKCNDAWYCFDPTWGAGYVGGGKFTRKFSPEYFMVPPGTFIETHMPLDPMWQCLRHPYRVQDFYAGEQGEGESGPEYSYSDSIDHYMQLSNLEQEEVTLRRIKEGRFGNNVIRDYVRFLQQTLDNAEKQKDYDQQKQMVDRLNEAVAHYNSAANLFNRYIHFYNRQFRPLIPDNDLRVMLDTCDRELAASRQIMQEVVPFNRETEQNLRQLTGIVHDLQNDIEKQKIFLRKYLATAKSSRGSLFRISY